MAPKTWTKKAAWCACEARPAIDGISEGVMDQPSHHEDPGGEYEEEGEGEDETEDKDAAALLLLGA